MNYRITEKRLSRHVDGVAHAIVTLVCDTAEDIPEPDPTWDAGSIAQICTPHGYKILNSEGEWC